MEPTQQRLSTAERVNLVAYLDVEIPVGAQRFVVLRNLEVLRHVGVEVILAREPAPRRDRAVQRETDPGARFDRDRVHDR